MLSRRAVRQKRGSARRRPARTARPTGTASRPPRGNAPNSAITSMKQRTDDEVEGHDGRCPAQGLDEGSGVASIA